MSGNVQLPAATGSQQDHLTHEDKGLVVWDTHEPPHIRVRGGSIYRHMGAELNVRLGSDIIQNQSVHSSASPSSDSKKKQVIPNSYSTKQQEVQV